MDRDPVRERPDQQRTRRDRHRARADDLQQDGRDHRAHGDPDALYDPRTDGRLRQTGREDRGGGCQPRCIADAGVPAHRLAAHLAGIALGSLLCFVLAVSSFITPKLLGGGRVFLLATEIYDQAIVTLNWPLAATLPILILVIFGGALVLYTRALRAIM